MRSYGQYCAVAKSLDVIGDRWNLLIVRELLLRGDCRYVDLLAGLPGIATNLLVDRLRALEQAGVTEREEAPPPIASTLYRLTERGHALRPVLVELARWGVPLMHERGEQETFRGHWVAALAELIPVDRDPAGPPVTIELHADGEVTTLELAGGRVRARPGPAAEPDLTLSGPADLLLGAATGRLAPADAVARGLLIEGEPSALARLAPPPGAD